MRRDELQHTGHAAAVERGAASMVTRSGVGTTSVTLSDRGTKDNKVEDTVANTMDVNPCISLIRTQSTRAAARGLRESQNSSGIDSSPQHRDDLLFTEPAVLHRTFLLHPFKGGKSQLAMSRISG
jgi:hypothetical protein